MQSSPSNVVMAVHDDEHHNSDLQSLAALPQALLELVLVTNTSTEDKKSLRQTCKLFQRTLDDRLACFKLTANEEQPFMANLLKRMKHVQSLKTVVLETQCDTTAIDSLIDCLPGHITMLRINGCGHVMKAGLDLQNAQLPHLTSLSLGALHCALSGLQCITGLTHLRCYSEQPAGSLAHLAPTLKHLDIWEIESVQDINQLTNLDVFQVRSIPRDFFKTHGHLPLQHLTIRVSSMDSAVFRDSKAWESAPTTLTRLTMDTVSLLMPGVLPAHITHLQMGIRATNIVDQAAAALPGMNALDVWMYKYVLPVYSERGSVFQSLGRFTNLETLGMCVLDVKKAGTVP